MVRRPVRVLAGPPLVQFLQTRHGRRPAGRQFLALCDLDEPLVRVHEVGIGVDSSSKGGSRVGESAGFGGGFTLGGERLRRGRAVAFARGERRG